VAVASKPRNPRSVTPGYISTHENPESLHSECLRNGCVEAKYDVPRQDADPHGMVRHAATSGELIGVEGSGSRGPPGSRSGHALCHVRPVYTTCAPARMRILPGVTPDCAKWTPIGTF